MTNHRLNLEIERWRAVAVLLTLVQHLGNIFAERRPWGQVLDGWGCWIGVDLFFVISGLVITASLAESLARQPAGVALRQFFIKRCWRLWPLAWGWVAVMLTLSAYWPEQSSLGMPAANQQAAVGVLLHLANLLAYSVHAGWGWLPQMPNDSFGVYWSLSLEEQFYAVFALFFFLVRGSPRACVVLALGLLAISLPWARPFPAAGWFVRLDALALGCLLYWGREPLRRLLSVCPSGVGRVLSLLAVLAAVVLAPVISQWPGGVTLIALLCAWPVALATLAQGRSLSCGAWGNRLLEYLGSRSYSLYLAHMPVFRLMQVWPQPLAGNVWLDVGYGVMVLLLVLLAAEAGYRYLETPCRAIGRRWAAAQQINHKERVPCAR